MADQTRPDNSDSDSQAVEPRGQSEQANQPSQADSAKDAQKLHAALKKYTTLFELSPIGYVTLDHLGHISEINLTVARLLGMNRDQLVGKKLVDFVEASDKSALEEHLRQCCTLGQVTCEIHLVSHDGRKVPVELRSFYSMSSTEPGTACRTAITDITERVKAEAQRRQVAQQARRYQELENLGAVIGKVAHDFNDFLMVILGNAEMAFRSLPDSSEEHSCVAQIKSSALQARNLTRQMLIYAGKGKSNLKAVDLNHLIQETADLLKATVSEGAELQINLAGKLPLIQADVSQIRQLVRNLVANAARSLGPAKGTIGIRTYVRDVVAEDCGHLHCSDGFNLGQCAVLEVSDTGPVLNHKTMDKLFDPAFTTKLTERGEGLSVVLGIVRAHKGAIAVDSAPGKGTTFSMYLQCAEAQVAGVARADREEPASPWRGTGEILIADDDPAVLSTLSRMCRRLGFGVHTAADGQQAVDIFTDHANQIVAILLDYEMPGISCQQTVEQLRKTKPQIPIVISSGYAEEDTISHFTVKGLVDFIQKPYELENLSEKIREILGNQA